jgi:hypothetical protein
MNMSQHHNKQWHSLSHRLPISTNFLWDTWIILLMALYKLDFTMDQYGWKAETSNNFWRKPPISNFNNICIMVYDIHGGVHLLPDINQALMLINTPDKQNYCTTRSKSLPYRIWKNLSKSLGANTKWQTDGWLDVNFTQDINFLQCKESIKGEVQESYLVLYLSIVLL